MKKRALLGSIVIALVSLLSFAGLVSAHTFRSGDNVSLSSNQKIDDTVFVSGRSIEIASEINGDVFCAGQNITVSGNVHGDVICAGQTVNITGKVDGDIRLAGQTVTINSEVGGNATVAGQSSSLGAASKINGDLSVGTADGTVAGTVGRDLAVGASNIVISNQIGRNVKGSVERMSLQDGASVKGNIEYSSWNELNRSGGSFVGGTITRTDPPQKQNDNNGAVFNFGIGWFIYWFLAMLLTALAIVLLFPALVHRSSDRAIAEPWKVGIVGFAASIAIPVLMLVLAITIIGIPLAVVVCLLWCLIAILSGPFFAYLLGRLILRQTRNPILIMLVGAVVLLVLYFIPFVGLLALIIAYWFGSGMIILELMDRTPRPVYEISEPAEVPLSAPAKRKTARRRTTKR